MFFFFFFVVFFVFFFFFFCFFFFKQKTAYEIRPRDWSSDVCSSDLVAYHPAGKEVVSEFLYGFFRFTLQEPLSFFICLVGFCVIFNELYERTQLGKSRVGRASCRERV